MLCSNTAARLQQAGLAALGCCRRLCICTLAQGCKGRSECSGEARQHGRFLQQPAHQKCGVRWIEVRLLLALDPQSFPGAPQTVYSSVSVCYQCEGLKRITPLLSNRRPHCVLHDVMACHSCRAADVAERPATQPAAEAPQAAKETPSASSREASANPAAPKSNWEAAELARRAAAAKPGRAPADAPAESHTEPSRIGPAAQPSRREAGAALPERAAAGAEPAPAQGKPLEASNAAPADSAPADSAAEADARKAAAAARRNDEDRVAAARERFLARKRKVGDA